MRRALTKSSAAAGRDFEKLGVFYLGRPFDPIKKKPKPGLLLYDSKDLVTHAVCVGMTGSGKTGLCIGILEEAAIDGIPAVVVDPKGDLANLLLTFPDLRPQDFAPWVNQDDARKKGVSVEQYAAQQADLWKNGLAEWGQDGRRIERLREAADFVVYTPGSNAGIPVSILKSFAAPGQAILSDEELLRERIGTTVTGLLGLLGIDADPIKSREHILTSTILHTAWSRGQDLDLAALIRYIQTPPISRIGVLDVDTFYPSKERFALAMQFNNLLAAPGFSAWLEGEALEIQSMLHAPDGKPRIAIFSIAHLNDGERMFFVSLLLNQVLGWVRAQSGTTTLRALIYMDEIFGYFPPVANPPSKAPLLTLLKQARAFGVGMMLATQNPVDLDYKGLANTGTWFIGRLQTERDRARVLDGLEGAAAGTGKAFDRRSMEQMLAGLGSRIFLMNNVHEDAPEVFESRWTLSYLRGPLTREQIKVLMQGRRSAPSAPSQTPPSESVQATANARSSRPVLPSDVPQYFIPVRSAQPPGTRLVYRPTALGASQVRVADTKTGVDVTENAAWIAPITTEAIAVDWDRGTALDVPLDDLDRSPVDGAQFADVPSAAGKRKSYDGWGKDLAGWLYRNRKIELFKSAGLNEVSNMGESERDFRIRLQQRARERRDEAAEALRKKYTPKIAGLQDRIRRAEQAVARETQQARQSQIQTAISVGATLLGAFLGRKTISASTLERATTAVRGAGRAIKESRDVGQAKETVEALQQQLADLESQFKAETDALDHTFDPQSETLETIRLRPSKSNISVRLMALAWAPYWEDGAGTATPAWT